MSEAEIRAYVTADYPRWPKMQAGTVNHWDLCCSTSPISMYFDVTLTGFELPEIDLLIGELIIGRRQ